MPLTIECALLSSCADKRPTVASKQLLPRLGMQQTQGFQKEKLTYVRIVCGTTEFVVPFEIAVQSETITTMLKNQKCYYFIMIFLTIFFFRLPRVWLCF